MKALALTKRLLNYLGRKWSSFSLFSHLQNNGQWVEIVQKVKKGIEPQIAVGRVVASNTRGLQFKSSHWKNL